MSTQFVSCLPLQYLARDGETFTEVDPFAHLRRVFAGNRRGHPAEIPGIVEQMLAVADQAGLTHSHQDHENLVELVCSAGLISRDQEASFFLRAGHGQTPREALGELVDEMEATQALGLGKITASGQVTLLTQKPRAGGIERGKNETYLVLNGYDGRICRFPMLMKNDCIIVLQPREHQGTSVTNLAEAIYQTTQSAYPGKKVHEAYERDFDEGKDHVSEITLDSAGCAQWTYDVDPELRKLVYLRITQMSLDR